MKKILIVLASFCSLLSSCAGDDEPSATTELQLISNDSIALAEISKEYLTTSSQYPSPWSFEDPSSWGDNVRLDTITDTETGEQALAVAELKLYIINQDVKMGRRLQALKHVKSLTLLCCAGAEIIPEWLPVGCENLLIDKINPDEPGRINIGFKVDRHHYFDIFDHMQVNRWEFKNLIIHNTNMTYLAVWLVNKFRCLDVSNNELEKVKPYHALGYWEDFECNLSHNNIKEFFNMWGAFEFVARCPNMQYNEIEIPDWVIGTDWWKKNHENFIGNPGYVAPDM